MDDEIIISDRLDEVQMMQRRGYLTHAYCPGGGCRFVMDGKEFSLSAGDCMIVPQQEVAFRVEDVSTDFAVEVIYVKLEFIQMATPYSNYGTRGHLALFENPVMHLTAAQQQVCALNFDYIRRRLAMMGHHFHRDAMINAVQCMIIDFFDFHVELYGDRKLTNQRAQTMQRFMAMLDNGEFVRHRDVGYYADALCITPKYLSEVCRQVSGQSAMYWISRYTALDISRTLRNRALTLDEVADHYGFASTNYFVRYVQKHLGAPPSSFRK